MKKNVESDSLSNITPYFQWYTTSKYQYYIFPIYIYMLAVSNFDSIEIQCIVSQIHDYRSENCCHVIYVSVPTVKLMYHHVVSNLKDLNFLGPRGVQLYFSMLIKCGCDNKIKIYLCITQWSCIALSLSPSWSY